MTASQERIVGVHELTLDLKQMLEETTAGLWVEGEVGSLTRPPSGHVYFSLKDERRDSMLDCVMYRREAMRTARQLTEGARVQVLGRASFYPPRGRLQWIAEVARSAGQGSLLEALARLRQKLVDEGLTDAARKRPLPTDPKLIGVVTSRTGAAFADICSVALRRSNVRILLSPATVQGEDAPASIIAAIDRIERVAELDVLIVGRGGGSQEDLMAFNSELVVRRLTQCRVPVVSAVGHEIDVSLSDLVADARAATPSQAAELIVPSAEERRARLVRLKRHLGQAARTLVVRQQLAYGKVSRRLGDPRAILAGHEQELDEVRRRLDRAMRSHLAMRRQGLDAYNRRLTALHPRAVLAHSRARFRLLEQRLRGAAIRDVEVRLARLREAARALQALSPLAILGRGYALATNSAGVALRRAAEVRPGQDVKIRLNQGTFSAQVTHVVMGEDLGE